MRICTPSFHKKESKKECSSKDASSVSSNLPLFLSSVLPVFGINLFSTRNQKKSAKDALFLRGEGHGSRDAENAGSIRVGGNSLEVDRDTSGHVAGNREALVQGGGGNGDGAGVDTSGQSGAEIATVGVNIDSPCEQKKKSTRQFLRK